MLCLCSFAYSVCVRSLGGLQKCVGKCWYMGRVLEFVGTFPEILELCDALPVQLCVQRVCEISGRSGEMRGKVLVYGKSPRICAITCSTTATSTDSPRRGD